SERSKAFRGGGTAAAAATASSPPGAASAPRTRAGPGSGTVVMNGLPAPWFSSQRFRGRRKLLRTPVKTGQRRDHFRPTEAGKVLALLLDRGGDHGGTSQVSRHGRRSARGGQRRRSRGEGAIDAGRRVRARRDASHSGRQARRSLDEAGGRDRPLQG